jgi:hypothetical protein
MMAAMTGIARRAVSGFSAACDSAQIGVNTQKCRRAITRRSVTETIVYRQLTRARGETTMSVGTIEECVDELDGFVDTLTRYPEPVLALALRIHLGALLRALLESRALSGTQAREFLRDLAREVFDEQDEAPK